MVIKHKKYSAKLEYDDMYKIWFIYFFTNNKYMPGCDIQEHSKIDALISAKKELHSISEMNS